MTFNDAKLLNLKTGWVNSKVQLIIKSLNVTFLYF